MKDIKTILCPVDFSDTSSRAQQTATTLAKKFDASLHLLHVCQLPSSPMDTDGMVPMENFETEYLERFGQQLDELKAAVLSENIDTHSHLTTGIPYHEIVQLAENLNADLIVLGTHGRSGLAHLLIGSVAERVVRASKTPVLTIPLTESN